MTEQCIDGVCSIIPKFIKTYDKSVLTQKVPVEQANAYSDRQIRARDDNGQFIPDDESTEDINEAYTYEKKTLEEFTWCREVGDLLFVQVTGGYTPNNCFNSRKFPVTDELLDWYLSLGDTSTVKEYNTALSFIQEDMLDV